MRIGIFFYSETGNTEKIANAIKNKLTDNVDFLNMEHIIPDSVYNYDLLFLGTPVQGDNIPEKIRESISKEIAGKKIAVFFTHAAPMESYSPTEYLKNIKSFFNNLGAELTDTWHCRGENKRTDILEWLKKNNPERYKQAITAKGLPDLNDMNSAAEWAFELVNSLDLVE